MQRGQARWKLYALSAQFSREAEIAIKNKAHYNQHHGMARLELGKGLGYCYSSDRMHTPKGNVCWKFGFQLVVLLREVGHERVNFISGFIHP